MNNDLIANQKYLTDGYVYLESIICWSILYLGNSQSMKNFHIFYEI